VIIQHDLNAKRLGYKMGIRPLTIAASLKEDKFKKIQLFPNHKKTDMF